MKSKSEKKFRKRVAKLLAADESASTLETGWPWPWEYSNTTDYSYAFDGDTCYVTCFGLGWRSAAEAKIHKKAWKKYEKKMNSDPDSNDDCPEELFDDNEQCTFPNMKKQQNVTLGKRSGVLIVGG